MHLILGWPRFDNELYNVVTSNATVNDIVEIIKGQIPEVRIELVDSKIMNQLSYTVLANKFRDRGFKFQGDLRSGVVETLDLLKALHGRSAVDQAR